MSEQHRPHQDQDPGMPDDELLFVVPFTRRHDGSIVATGHTRASLVAEREGRAEMSTELLQQGDEVGITYVNRDGYESTASFNVKETLWDGLGIGEEPQMSVSGELILNDPEEAKVLDGFDAQNASLSGAAATFTSLVQQGVIATGRSTAFSMQRLDKSKLSRPLRYGLTNTTDFSVKHRGRDGMAHDVHPGRRQNEMYRELPEHRQKIAGIQHFLEKYGFDAGSFTAEEKNGSTSKRFENKRLVVNYRPGNTTGNEVTIDDKATGKRIRASYVPSKDILKVATINMGDPAVTNGESSLEGRQETITHVTSEKNNIDTFIYGMDRVKAEILGMPKVRGVSMSPDLRITKGDEAGYHVEPIRDAIYSINEDYEKYVPGGSPEFRAMKKAFDSMRIDISPQNVPQLHIGEGRTLLSANIYDPHRYLDDVLSYQE